MKAFGVALWVCLLAGACGSLQKPVNFVATNKLDGAIAAVSEALEVAGYASKKIGRQSNVVQTDWQDTQVASGLLKEKPATVVRRFTVTVAPVANGVNVSVRMDLKRCQQGAVKVVESADSEETSAEAEESAEERAADEDDKKSDKDKAGKSKSKDEDEDEDDKGKKSKKDDGKDDKGKKAKKSKGDDDKDDASEQDDAKDDADGAATDAESEKGAKAKQERAAPVETTLHGPCEDLTVMPSGFQEELQALAQKLEAALRDAKEPPAEDTSEGEE